MLVRAEEPGDEAAIARLTDAAFGGSEESRIIDAIRRAGRPRISLVAVDDQLEIVGSILFTPVVVERSGSTAAMGLGPMAVLPALQRRGIGSLLVRAGLKECERTGCHAVVVVGHPQFYPRFGFRPASSHGLRCEYPVPDDVFMALELTPGALTAVEGLVRYAPEFGPG